MRWTRQVLLIALLTFVACAASASGSTLTAAPDPKDPGYQTIAHYTAAPGEVNRVAVSRVTDYVIRIADAGAEIRVGRGCRSLDAHLAECATPGSNRDGPNWLITAEVSGGDGSDEIRSREVGLDADGGPGDDLVEVDAGIASTLNGGGGRDHLVGGRNSDTLTDGDTSVAADADVLDGREERDTVSYASRTARVTVDLSRPATGGGEASEHDTLISIESAEGGAGPDVLRAAGAYSSLEGGPGADRLTGQAGPDFIFGGRGDDAVAGGDGDDIIDGGAGADSVYGGRGSDQLDGGAGRDRLDGGSGDDWLSSGAAVCGPGTDSAYPTTGDLIHRSCEQLSFGLRMRPNEVVDAKGVDARPYPRRGRSSLTFQVRCPHTETDGYPSGLQLRGSLRLSTRGGRLLAAGVIPRTGRACRGVGEEDASELPWIGIRARLTAAGRQVLSRARPARAIVRFTGRNVPPVPWQITLRP